MTDTSTSSLAERLKAGACLDRIDAQGRASLTLTPDALDGITDVLKARARHRAVDPDVLALLTHWQSYICNAPSTWGSRRGCLQIVEQPGLKCRGHQSIGQIHPDARGRLAAVTPRAKRLLDWLVKERIGFTRGPYSSSRYVSRQLGVSESTLGRATSELAEQHIAWRENQRMLLHPAIAYFDGYESHRDALSSLRLDRRQAWQHLEPPAEEVE
ncbi:hypothetical protein [Streptomyces sp. NPDC004330]|uniref:hypothetical protein n=1 Tax=Streptomyces sp. NPDC004330 TaxID=3364700 RepID=UPI0036737F12